MYSSTVIYLKNDISYAIPYLEWCITVTCTLRVTSFRPLSVIMFSTAAASSFAIGSGSGSSDGGVVVETFFNKAGTNTIRRGGREEGRERASGTREWATATRRAGGQMKTRPCDWARTFQENANNIPVNMPPYNTRMTCGRGGGGGGRGISTNKKQHRKKKDKKSKKHEKKRQKQSYC